MHQDVADDAWLQKIKSDIKQDIKAHKEYTVIDDTLLFKGRYVLAKKSEFIGELLREYHDFMTGGHAGELKTYLWLTGDWFWEGMRKDVGLYVQQCKICQQQKASQQSPAGLLQPLPLPDLVLEEVSLDFIDALPMSKGFNSFLVVVDRLSKYGHFIGLRHPYSAVTVAGVFVQDIVRLHGFPTAIVSDRDRIFLSNLWSELFRLQGTVLKKSTAYHP